ncbi:hypothetical protein FUAX_38860 (plasmid) [Fulvitalea axinellae]|uniref:Gliding motility-associated C-terminal domain-containing protein n=2 Tax=Fulvitalea axinellae TaxID=1182444 RepID=A0AAU9CY74_9BACT|nr:hypothetical protein FUAX_38860 [Fulvitalea axinellae]
MSGLRFLAIILALLYSPFIWAQDFKKPDESPFKKVYGLPEDAEIFWYDFNFDGRLDVLAWDTISGKSATVLNYESGFKKDSLILKLPDMKGMKIRAGYGGSSKVPGLFVFGGGDTLFHTFPKFSGIGTISFDTLKSVVPKGFVPSEAELTDADNDGLAEFVFLDEKGKLSLLEWLEGKPEIGRQDTLGTYEGRLLVGHFNYDGYRDYLVADSTEAISLFNKGKFKLKRDTIDWEIEERSLFLLEDFDDDGTQDWVYIDSLGFLRAKAGNTLKDTIYEVDTKVPYPNSVFIADLNSDGKSDLLISSDSLPPVFFKRSSKGFERELPFDSASSFGGRAFPADYDFDGDLDIFVSKDTTIAFFENQAPKNYGPRLVDKVEHFLARDRLVLIWPSTSDDHSSSSVIGYELRLQDFGKPLKINHFAGVNYSKTEYRRYVTGPSYHTNTNTMIIENLEKGDYILQILPLDNSYHTYKLDYPKTKTYRPGDCVVTGAFPKYEPMRVCFDFIEKDTVACSGKKINFKMPGTLEAVWFSDVYGMLGQGNSLEYTVPDEEDAVYANERGSSDCKNNFVWNIKVSDAGGKKLYDKEIDVCKGSEYSFEKWEGTPPIWWMPEDSDIQNTSKAVLIEGDKKLSFIVGYDNKHACLSGKVTVTPKEKRIELDTALCAGTMLDLSLPSPLTALWNSERSGDLGESSSISYKIEANDILSAKIKDSDECEVRAWNIEQLNSDADLLFDIDTVVCEGRSLDFPNPDGAPGFWWKNLDTGEESSDASFEVEGKFVNNFEVGYDPEQKCVFGRLRLRGSTVRLKADTLSCAKETIQFSLPDGSLANWISSEKGDLGDHVTLDYEVVGDDVLFGNKVGAVDCDENVIWAIQQANPEDDKLFIESETICHGETFVYPNSENASGFWWENLTLGTEGTSAETVIDGNFVHEYKIGYDPAYRCIHGLLTLAGSKVEVSVGSTNTDAFYGEPLEIPISVSEGGLSLELTPGGSVSNPINFEALEDGEYTLKATNEHGCEDESKFSVSVKYAVFIPELFSPNGDGANDTFGIFYHAKFNDFGFMIFNRFGQLMYEASSPEEAKSGWDGKISGSEQPAGIYYWKLTGKFADGSPVNFEGKTEGTLKLTR